MLLASSTEFTLREPRYSFAGQMQITIAACRWTRLIERMRIDVDCRQEALLTRAWASL